jgi:hypothetical protein
VAEVSAKTAVVAFSVLNGTSLEVGDGTAVSEERNLSFKANEESEFLVFDLN